MSSTIIVRVRIRIYGRPNKVGRVVKTCDTLARSNKWLRTASIAFPFRQHFNRNKFSASEYPQAALVCSPYAVPLGCLKVFVYHMPCGDLCLRGSKTLYRGVLAVEQVKVEVRKRSIATNGHFNPRNAWVLR